MPKEFKKQPKQSVPMESLRLEWRSPDELAENPKNWRSHPPAQAEVVKDVLAEVGWAGACLYNERTGRLIDGHLRRKLAAEQGVAKIPVLIGSWDEATEAKILATLDPTAAMAESNAAMLDDLLKEIEFDGSAIDDLLRSLNPDYENAEDEQPDEETKPTCRFPIAASMDEGYDYVLIFAKTTSEISWLETVLDLPRVEKKERKTAVGTSRVLTVEEFKKRWKS